MNSVLKSIAAGLGAYVGTSEVSYALVFSVVWSGLEICAWANNKASSLVGSEAHGGKGYGKEVYRY